MFRKVAGLFALLILLPVLASAASRTVPPSLSQPSQECRLQSIVKTTLGTKGGTYVVNQDGAAFVEYQIVDTNDAAIRLDLYVDSDTSNTWRSSSGRFVFAPSTAYTFNNRTTATGKVIYLMKCH